MNSAEVSALDRLDSMLEQMQELTQKIDGETLEPAFDWDRYQRFSSTLLHHAADFYNRYP